MSIPWLRKSAYRWPLRYLHRFALDFRYLALTASSWPRKLSGYLARLGPTGTPLIAGEEERTQKVFGDYVSIYDFSRSIEDGATVPHYDENPIPELQLTNKDLNGYMEELLEADELVDAQERLLERKFACEYHLMTREDRLETIAEDLVQHFATAQKANRAYAHIYDSYFGAGRSAYEDAAV